MVHGTVRRFAAAETVASHDALEPATLGGSGDIDLAALGELLDGELVAGLHFLVALDLELANEANRGGAGRSQVAEHRLRVPLLLDGLVHEADLGGAIAVGFFGLHLQNHTGTGLEHGNGNVIAGIVEDPGHPDFLTYQSLDHSCLPTLVPT